MAAPVSNSERVTNAGAATEGRPYNDSSHRTERQWVGRLLQNAPDYPEALLKLSSTSRCSYTYAHRMWWFFASGYKRFSRCDSHATTSELC